MKLGKISPNKGSVKKTKRLGRGNATGQGRTAGKGHKGYKSRSGASTKFHFEGGQTPMARRIPKRGLGTGKFNHMQTKNLVTQKEINLMKRDTILINTSRGGIINENDLYNALKKKKIHSAALDVYAKEPYFGRLKKLDNCHCTPHIASMSISCRNQMEFESTNEIIRFFKGKKLKFEVKH